MRKMIMIVAVDENWAIGKDNGLLYNVPTDMKFFRETTMGQIVVYGLNTLNSFPKQQPLPKRTNIVLSPLKVDKENLITARSIEELKEILSEINTEQQVFICGGASVYKQMIVLGLCEEAYITKIHTTTEGADVFFPNLDDIDGWEMVEESEKILDETSGLYLTFTKYQNIA